MTAAEQAVIKEAVMAVNVTVREYRRMLNSWCRTAGGFLFNLNEYVLFSRTLQTWNSRWIMMYRKKLKWFLWKWFGFIKKILWTSFQRIISHRVQIALVKKKKEKLQPMKRSSLKLIAFILTRQLSELPVKTLEVNFFFLYGYIILTTRGENPPLPSAPACVNM